MADMTGVGGRGAMVSSKEEIFREVGEAMGSGEFRMINVMINPSAGRKAQQHEWLTRAKL